MANNKEIPRPVYTATDETARLATQQNATDILVNADDIDGLEDLTEIYTNESANTDGQVLTLSESYFNFRELYVECTVDSGTSVATGRFPATFRSDALFVLEFVAVIVIGVGTSNYLTCRLRRIDDTSLTLSYKNQTIVGRVRKIYGKGRIVV